MCVVLACVDCHYLRPYLRGARNRVCCGGMISRSKDEYLTPRPTVPPSPSSRLILNHLAVCVFLKQGTKFTSWEDVFPDMEARGGAEGAAAPPPGGLLETDSDDSDDESFKVLTVRMHAVEQC